MRVFIFSGKQELLQETSSRHSSNCNIIFSNITFNKERQQRTKAGASTAQTIPGMTNPSYPTILGHTTAHTGHTRWRQSRKLSPDPSGQRFPAQGSSNAPRMALLEEQDIGITRLGGRGRPGIVPLAVGNQPQWFWGFLDTVHPPCAGTAGLDVGSWGSSSWQERH